MARRKGSKMNVRKTSEDSQPRSSQGAKTEPQTLKPSTGESTRHNTKQLPLAGPTTPVQPPMQQNVITPELERAMDRDDVADIAAAAETLAISPAAQVDEAKALVDRQAKALVDKQAALLEATFRRVKKEEGELEIHLNRVTEEIAVLKKKWDEGKISLTRNRYTTELDKSLKMQQELMRRLSLLWTKGAALAGSWTANIVGEGIKRDSDEDWTLIDAVLRCYPELEDARKIVKLRRTEQQQVLFKKKLFAAYETGPNNETELIYCPILHERMDHAAMKAAHIVKVNVGPKTAEALFGEREDHIWSPKNGLVIHHAYERLLDDAKAVILPASDNPGETELVFLLLTRDIGRAAATVWGYETLHGRRLQFLNKYRPAKRYLYFKATMALLRRRRADVDGHWNDLDQLPAVAKTMWASPGPYLKNSILYRFSRELGCLTKEDANRFWDTDTGTAFASLTLENTQTAAALALHASNAALTRGSSEGEGEEAGEEAAENSDDPFL
ncbi:hypothetical protein F503_06800 [Ophiostoma piceae UAMH 11346]|uniref:HNH nuclease domain-containing protein n=1 Tax=Ophiostoma piceae (strain UAMH 11346) TaxID=1262450 RepID=S3C641_OPHP1|nr:hypothetical protein F503_06800 [Ophiostoma piceae UAMH 11346]